jgi:hypothetical protein
MALVPIKIPEGDEPLLTFDADSDITGATVQWVSKATADATDGSGVTIAGTITSAANGIFTIQLEDTVTGSGVGHTFYKVVVTQSSHPVTVQHGPLVIENV